MSCSCDEHMILPSICLGSKQREVRVHDLSDRSASGTCGQSANGRYWRASGDLGSRLNVSQPLQSWTLPYLVRSVLIRTLIRCFITPHGPETTKDGS